MSRNLAGYAYVWLSAKVDQEQTKPFFGKPYFKLSHALGVWGFMFQLGALLGARYRGNLDDFGAAFLGASGPPGVVKSFFEKLAADLQVTIGSEPMSFTDLVANDFSQRTGFRGGLFQLIQQKGMDKIFTSTVGELAMQQAQRGSALGVIMPDTARAIYERTYRRVPDAEYELLRSAGLKMPPIQEVLTYEEAEREGVEGFVDYCRHCCPEILARLSEVETAPKATGESPILQAMDAFQTAFGQFGDAQLGMSDYRIARPNNQANAQDESAEPVVSTETLDAYWAAVESMLEALQLMLSSLLDLAKENYSSDSCIDAFKMSRALFSRTVSEYEWVAILALKNPAQEMFEAAKEEFDIMIAEEALINAAKEGWTTEFNESEVRQARAENTARTERAKLLQETGREARDRAKHVRVIAEEMEAMDI